MLRIGLFLATNFAIMLLISLIFQIFGLEGILAENQRAEGSFTSHGPEPAGGIADVDSRRSPYAW